MSFFRKVLEAVAGDWQRTGDATATDGGFANTGTIGGVAAPINYDRSPVFWTARQEAADRLKVGPPVTMPRQVANSAEVLLSRLAANPDALDALGLTYDELRVAAIRQALSDAIEAADKARD